MKSNYKRFGDYIKEVKVRNSELKAKRLLGINIDKFFMPSVANVVGTDMSVYKIVKTNQFACNRMHVGRDKRLPVALSNLDEEFMVSPAYDVFEIIDTNILLPEYLMMWFTRREFDRNAWFYTDADVRGGLAWKAFLDMQLPIPSIEKQKEIVKEYHVLENRIDLNNQLIAKLEETAQAIYKQWFVDFEFPDEDGKPYKSNGGEMVWCEELEKEIPVGWEYNNLGNIIETINGFAFKSEDFNSIGQFPIIKIKNIKAPYVYIQNDTQYYAKKITQNLKKVTVEKGDVIISMTGSGANQLNSAVGQVGKYYYRNESLLNQRVCKLLPLKESYREFVYQFISSKDIQSELLNGSTGSANQANISPNQIKDLELIIPSESMMIKYSTITDAVDNFKSLEIIDKLAELKQLILAKMTKFGTEIEVV
jgi:type I restriction enzyme S subunit